MILVDTSVWIDHLSRSNQRLASLLEEGKVLGHRFVEGELACGHLRNRSEILNLVRTLPQATQVSHTDVMDLLERKRLHGRGMSWIDLHLLASARFSDCTLWSLDGELSRSAEGLGIATNGSPTA